MKKLYVAGLAIASLGLAATAAYGGLTPGSGIVGSKHDISINTSLQINDDGLGGTVASTDHLNRVCIYCHAPHHTRKPNNTETYMPLWNRPQSQAWSFIMYDNGDNPQEYGDHDGDPGTPDELVNHNSYAADNATQPGAVSMLCLSCHDGTVAVNTYGQSPQDSASQNVGAGYISTQYKIGDASATGDGDLSNHHPIGFDYNATAAHDDEIYPSSTAMGTTGYTIGELLSSNGTMECNTCHDVHNTKNLGGKFIWVEDTGSAFCLTCHDK